MAGNVKKIVEGFGAETIGRIPETGGGAEAFHMASENDLGSIGSMRDAAEELDAIVEDAMRMRRLQAWRPSPEDFEALEVICAETGRSMNDLLNEALHLLFRQQDQERA